MNAIGIPRQSDAGVDANSCRLRKLPGRQFEIDCSFLISQARDGEHTGKIVSRK
jgi:hypothetical protein